MSYPSTIKPAKNFSSVVRFPKITACLNSMHSKRKLMAKEIFAFFYFGIPDICWRPDSAKNPQSIHGFIHIWKSCTIVTPNRASRMTAVLRKIDLNSLIPDSEIWIWPSSTQIQYQTYFCRIVNFIEMIARLFGSFVLNSMAIGMKIHIKFNNICGRGKFRMF